MKKFLLLALGLAACIGTANAAEGDISLLNKTAYNYPNSDQPTGIAISFKIISQDRKNVTAYSPFLDAKFGGGYIYQSQLDGLSDTKDVMFATYISTDPNGGDSSYKVCNDKTGQPYYFQYTPVIGVDVWYNGTDFYCQNDDD